MQSNHNGSEYVFVNRRAQNYLDISKNAIKSQQVGQCMNINECSKLPRYFKECNQITTSLPDNSIYIGSKLPRYFKECNQITTPVCFFGVSVVLKITSIFQRMQSNHNFNGRVIGDRKAQNYLDISKNAIKSQLELLVVIFCKSSKLPRYFKECNQVRLWYNDVSNRLEYFNQKLKSFKITNNRPNHNLALQLYRRFYIWHL